MPGPFPSLLRRFRSPRCRCAAAVAPITLCAFALAAPPIFPPDHPWNQQVSSAPVAANSAAIMNSIITTFGNNRLHPDFGQDYVTAGTDLYGIPYNAVHGASTPFVSVVIDAYPTQSDIQPAPIPANAVIEGDFQSGPRAGLNARGDSHLLIWDIDSNICYEFYRASRPSENADGRWHADGEAVWNFNTNIFRPLHWTSADAAGLSILAGLARPDEGLPVAQGGQGIIRHAIRFTLTNSVILNKFIYPASHIANPGNTNAAIQPPMGARFRLKSSVDISALNPQSKIIAQAMKDYGLILADNGSNFFFTGASYSPNATNGVGLTWNDNDIQDSVHGLKSLRFADFEVLDLTPRLTSISPAIAAAGSTVSITGQNFSGAAGRLSVLFGSTPPISIMVVDDAHLTAVAPGGTGTVDVRVQSGITDPADSSNINSPIFGYGTSAVSAADQFTYASGPPGICCRGATCTLFPQTACTANGAAGAVFQTTGTCNAPGNAVTPCCYADYNKAGAVTVQDIFDFVNDWLGASPYARYGGDGTPGPMTVQNIFDYIGAWFAACP